MVYQQSLVSSFSRLDKSNTFMKSKNMSYVFDDEEDLYYTYIIVSLSYLRDITNMLYWIH